MLYSGKQQKPANLDLNMDICEPAGDVTKDWLEKELSASQEQLDKRVKKLEEDDEDEDSDSDWDDTDGEIHRAKVSSAAPTPVDRLAELNDMTEALALAQEVTQWAQDSASVAEYERDIFRDAQDCVTLAKILCGHDSQSSLYKNLFEREYQPLHKYVRTNLIQQLRHILLQSGYPSAEGCGNLLSETSAPSALTQCCEWLTSLQATNHRLANHTYKASVSSSSSPWAAGETCDVLVELFRPIVERVRYHFVEYDTERATASKMDRLPEWLLNYLRESVIEGKASPGSNTSNTSSPWELATSGLAPCVTEEMPVLFLNELVGVVRWVLGSERNFFRHASVAGPGSKPVLLCNAIEQLLEFDDALRSLLPMGQADRLLRLMDIFVAGDEELLAWWLAREKEVVFSTLFDSTQDETNNDSRLPALVKSRISPRAELFCSLIRSVQVKGSVFSFSGPYLNAIAVPLCMKFLDAVHEAASDLRSHLANPRLMLHGSYLTANLEDWMAVINGTHLAAAILTRESPWAQASMAPSVNSSVNDLARFGRSLEQLQNVLVDEFATTFVESLLMEQMKLAAYLMRCSHFLSHNLDEGDYDDYVIADVSPDLKPTVTALSKFLILCNDNEIEEEPDEGHKFATQFAPQVMLDRIVPRLAEKFLEVALDLHGLTPEILPEGASIFAQDIKVLFGSLASTGEQTKPSSVVSRLIEIAKLMDTKSKPMKDFQAALLGLTGGHQDPERPWLLHRYQFIQDENIYEEAICMLKAKGFGSIDLDDAISILNRRRDLRE